MKLSEFQKIVPDGMNLTQLAEAMTRSDFNDFLKKGLKGLIVDATAKAAAKTTFMEIVTVDDSDSDKEDYPSMNDVAFPQTVLEGEEFPQLNPGAPDNVIVTNFKTGGLIELTTEAEEDDKTPNKSLARQALKLGPKHMAHKDKVFYSILTSNGTIYDGGNFFRLNHPGVTGGANIASNDNIYTNVTMSANALSAVLGIIALWQGGDADEDLDIMAERIVAPDILKQTALGLTRADLLPFAMAAGNLGPAATLSGGMPNAMKGKLGVTTSQRLDRSSTTDWYVKTDFPGLLYQRRKGIQVMQEAPNTGQHFSHGKLRWRSEERYGRKVINWRCFIYVS